MPDMTGDAKHINYSREDASTKRLWRTQIGKANPWDHRTGQHDGAEGGQEAPPDPGKPARPAEVPMIGQDDTLDLAVHEPPASNPFVSLLVHRRKLDPDEMD